MIRLVGLLMFPSLCASQNVDTIKVHLYSSDTATKPYRTMIYISKDTTRETIYRLSNKRSPKENRIIKRKNKTNEQSL